MAGLLLNDLSAADCQPSARNMKEEPGAISSDDDVVANHISDLTAAQVQQAEILQPTSLSAEGIPTQAVQFAAGDASNPGLQTLTMSNVSSVGNSIGRSAGGATILQYVQADDSQVLIPVSTLPGGNVQYQLVGAASSVPQGVVVANTSAGTSLTVKPNSSEEAARKRELRLLKNREAACECRRKKKEYVKCLENRVAVLENQNKILIEELKSLKELYCQKDTQS